MLARKDRERLADQEVVEEYGGRPLPSS